MKEGRKEGRKEGKKKGRVGLNAADGQWDQFCFGKEKRGSGMSRDEGEPAGGKDGSGGCWADCDATIR